MDIQKDVDDVPIVLRGGPDEDLKSSGTLRGSWAAARKPDEAEEKAADSGYSEWRPLHFVLQAETEYVAGTLPVLGRILGSSPEKLKN